MFAATLFLLDNIPSALDKVVTFAGEVSFGRNSPTSIKPEATLGERINLRVSRRPEEPHKEDEKAVNKFLLQSLIQQVSKYLKKSVLVAHLIKNFAQKKTEHPENYLVSHTGS